jgi:hypothetical protein
MNDNRRTRERKTFVNEYGWGKDFNIELPALKGFSHIQKVQSYQESSFD